MNLHVSEQQYAYARTTKHAAVVVVFNNDDKAAEIEFDVIAYWYKRRLYAEGSTRRQPRCCNYGTQDEGSFASTFSSSFCSILETTTNPVAKVLPWTNHA